MSSDVQEWTVLSMLEWGTDYFAKKEIPDPRHSIEWLLADALDIKRLDLYLSFDRPLSSSELDKIRPLVKRRANHEPLQYITGYSAFMNARIAVTPNVLIPRIETEQLVEIILDNHPKDSLLSVLDIGTGSGCIPIALKIEHPAWKLSGVDISKEALNLARDNAEQNNAADIKFTYGDIQNYKQWPFDESFDLMVSNPPYVLPHEKKELNQQVKNHEPSLALFCDNIEAMYQNIIASANHFLNKEGTLYLEINAAYAEVIMDLFTPNQWSCRVLKDYDKKNRFITAQRLV